MQVNQAAVNHAKALIEEGKYVTNTSWRRVKPSAEEENIFLKHHSLNDYSEWYLGIDGAETQQAKGHYSFPYGDFKMVHREGVIAAKHRAAQYGHADLEKAAGELLYLIDARERMKV